MAWYVIVAPLSVLVMIWLGMLWAWRRVRRLQEPAGPARVYPFEPPPPRYLTQEEFESFMQEFGARAEAEVKKMFEEEPK